MAAAPDRVDQLESRVRSMLLGSTGEAGPAPPLDNAALSPAHKHQQRAPRNVRGGRGQAHGRGTGRTESDHLAPSQDQSQTAPDSNRRQANYPSQRGSRDHGYHNVAPPQSLRVLQRDPSLQQGPRQHQQQQQQPNYHGPSNRSRGGGQRMGQMQPRFVQQQNVPLQCQFLEDVADQYLPSFTMSQEELGTKDRFRLQLQGILQRAVHDYYPRGSTEIALRPFGSLSSGFAMPGSDMDLVLKSSEEHPDIFRVFQRVLLEMGIGARVLSRTRVPILKICESPTPELLAALREERQKWDGMTPAERDAYDDGRPLEKDNKDDHGAAGDKAKVKAKGKADKKTVSVQPAATASDETSADNLHRSEDQVPAGEDGVDAQANPKDDAAGKHKTRGPRKEKPWYREKRPGPLDFPKQGVGIQCDINYENPLGVHNTALLRCYSHTDPRVRLLVLFVKGWASRRKINSSYNGTLSSYGYVLMVLHYLVNIAHPAVCPNLQLHRGGEHGVRHGHALAPDPDDASQVCQGFDVRFWRSEQEIVSLSDREMLTHSRESLGSLIRGFFLYYAQQGPGVPHGGFAWTQQVLSLRTRGGTLTKANKGWTGATTTIVNADGTQTVKPVGGGGNGGPKSNNSGNGGSKNSEGGRQHQQPAALPASQPPMFSHGMLHAPPQLASLSPLPALQQRHVVRSDQPQALPQQQTPTTAPAREVRNRYLFAIEDPFETTHNVARTVTHPGIVAIRDEFRRAWRLVQQVGMAGGNGNSKQAGVELMAAVESMAPPPAPAQSAAVEASADSPA